MPLDDPVGGRRGRPVRRDPLAEPGVVAPRLPGLKIVAPSMPGDAKALLKAAIRDDNPFSFLEHKRLYTVKGDAVDGDPVPNSGTRPGRARGVRRDARLASMKGVHDCLEAAERLARPRGRGAEVIDLRTLRPFDLETTMASRGQKTNRIVGRRGGAAHRWLGRRGARVRDRGRARRPRRRLADHDAELSDPVQPAARRRIPAGFRTGSSRRCSPGPEPVRAG